METILAAVVGGLFVLWGNFAMSRHQRKTLELQAENEKAKIRTEWERQEMRRLEERNFELKKEVYGSWIAMMRRAGSQPAQGMEIVAAIAALELCGSDTVRQEASGFVETLRGLAEKNLSVPDQEKLLRPAAEKLSAAILDDFRSHMQPEVRCAPLKVKNG